MGKKSKAIEVNRCKEEQGFFQRREELLPEDVLENRHLNGIWLVGYVVNMTLIEHRPFFDLRILASLSDLHQKLIRLRGQKCPDWKI